MTIYPIMVETMAALQTFRDLYGHKPEILIDRKNQSSAESNYE